MQLLKDYLKQYGFAASLVGICALYAVFSGYQAYEPAQATLEAPEATQQPQQVSLSELLALLKQVAQNPAEHTGSTVKTSADPMLEAIIRMDQNQQKLLQQIAERDRKMSEQLTQFISSSYRGGTEVDRSGNTKEQLEDIYQDVNLPQLPDPIVKGLAANPGARAMIHPDHGQPVIATTELGITNYGGGKQISIIRHGGKMYGQTVMHGDQSIQRQDQQQQAPKPEPFRLSLGNN